MKKTILSLLLSIPLLSHAGAISSGVGAYVGTSMAQSKNSNASSITSYPSRKTGYHTLICRVSGSGRCYYMSDSLTPAQFAKAMGYDIIYDFYPLVVSSGGEIQAYYILEVSN